MQNVILFISPKNYGSQYNLPMSFFTSKLHDM